MSARTDRSMQSTRLLVGVVIILATLVASGLILLWLRIPSTDTAQKPALKDRQLAQQFRSDESIPITLYYPDNGMLSTGFAVVKRQPDMQSQARESLAALFTDQRAAPAAVLRDIRLRELYLDAVGTAFIDLTPGPQKDVRASAWEEQLAIYAMVNTLVQNFEGIRQVVLMLDGRDAQTLAGHMDLSRTFTKRMDLVKQ